MLSGDISKVRAIVAELKRAGALAKTALPRNLGAELLTQAQLGFRNSVAPDGTPWAPLKFRSGKPLLDTGAHLYGSLHIARADPTAITLALGFAYAAVHQYGATIRAKKAKTLAFRIGGGKRAFAKQVVIPARPMLPVGTLPERWAQALVATAEEVMRKAFPAMAAE